MANYFKMFSILTDPLTENGEKFLVRSVRKFENFGLAFLGGNIRNKECLGFNGFSDLSFE